MNKKVRKIILGVLIVILLFFLACFKINTINKCVNLLRVIKKPKIFYCLLRSPKYAVFCYKNYDFCSSLIRYFDKLPYASEEENDLIDHINKYPSFINIFEKNPKVAKFCYSNWSDCMGIVKYLNENPAKAQELYSAPDQQEVLADVYVKALGDIGLQY